MDCPPNVAAAPLVVLEAEPLAPNILGAEFVAKRFVADEEPLVLFVLFVPDRAV